MSREVQYILNTEHINVNIVESWEFVFYELTIIGHNAKMHAVFMMVKYLN